ncbi:MAG: hypothetical protein WCC66_08450 [Rhizobiaceae bacterium]
MIREFSIEITEKDRQRMASFAGQGRIIPDAKPGRKTFTFDDKALTATAGDSFERFLWASFDRIEEKGGSIVLSTDNGVSFVLPIDKLQDPIIRRAIYDFVTGRLAVHG